MKNSKKVFLKMQCKKKNINFTIENISVLFNMLSLIWLTGVNMKKLLCFISIALVYLLQGIPKFMNISKQSKHISLSGSLVYASIKTAQKTQTNVTVLSVVLCNELETPCICVNCLCSSIYRNRVYQSLWPLLKPMKRTILVLSINSGIPCII